MRKDGIQSLQPAEREKLCPEIHVTQQLGREEQITSEAPEIMSTNSFVRSINAMNSGSVVDDKDRGNQEKLREFVSLQRVQLEYRHSDLLSFSFIFFKKILRFDVLIVKYVECRIKDIPRIKDVRSNCNSKRST